MQKLKNLPFLLFISSILLLSTYQVQAQCTLTLSTEIVTCDAETPGMDTYTVAIPFDNGAMGMPGPGGYVITTSGMIGGDNPMITQSGMIMLTFTEGSPYDYQIQGTMGNANMGCDISVTGVSPSCVEVQNIPTLGEWSLIILTLLLLITGIVGIRQTNATQSKNNFS